jgi:hypothetical protein
MAKEQSTLTSACQANEEDLVLLHYGDLADVERDRLSKHVTGCAACAGYLKELATLLPLTAKTDEPPPAFWMDYSRELRHKIDDAVENKSWWRDLASILRPRYLATLATAAIVVLALTFTLGKGIWPDKNQIEDDEIAEALPVAENLDFFNAMDILDDLDLLEFIGNQGNDAA